LPYLNYNNDRRTGVDYTINFNNRIGEVYYSLGFAGMFYNSKAIKRDEVYADAYQNRTGKPLDAYWGYIAEGLFKNQADIDNHAKRIFGDVKPGDIKYKDVYGDGGVDTSDEVSLGKYGWAVSPFADGMDLALEWRRLTLFALGSGQCGASGFKETS